MTSQPESVKISLITNAIEFIEACITQPGVYDTVIGQVDGVFHLAAIASVEKSRLEWSHTHAVNLTGFVRLLEAISQL